MSGYEEQELTAIDAALDANPDATSNEVFQATRPYDERAIASVAASRALAGGGGSIPDPITDPVTIALTDPAETALAVPVALGPQSVDIIAITNTDNDENLMRFGDAGDLEIGEPGTTNNPGIIVNNGFISVVAGGQAIFGVNRQGSVKFARNTDPGAGFVINPSEWTLWLDDTPGAAKLMVRAKDSNGDDVTGELPLTP